MREGRSLQKPVKTPKLCGCGLLLDSAYKMKRLHKVFILLVCLLLVSTTVIPYLLLNNLSDDRPQVTSTTPPYRTARKALDVNDEEERRLRNDISELIRIKHSVRNELRELEAQRVKIVQETEHHKSILFKLQDSISTARKQLQLTQYELSKVSHEVYSATKSLAPITITQAPPIVILPQAPIYPNIKPHPLYESESLDHSLCSLVNTFKVYLYETVHNNVKDYLINTSSLTKNKEEACLFVAIDNSSIKPESNNHILIILSSTVASSRRHGTILAQSTPSIDWRRGHDIIIPPLININNQPWRLVPAFRQFLFYFEGEPITQYDKDLSPWLQTLSSSIHYNSYIRTKCNKVHHSSAGGWGLCNNKESRSSLLSRSTYSLLISYNNDVNNQIRLSESLAYGSVPVIIGDMELPYQDVLDWNIATVNIPLNRINEIHYITSRISHNQLLEMRRIGRFYWESYFRSSFEILKTIITMLRYKLGHSPPVAPDYQPQRSKVFGKEDSPSIINVSLSAHQYQFWNRPPGPFYVYPYSPVVSPPPVSGSRYANMSINELRKLPPHIVQAAGITGPYFQNYLLGDVPEEYFTVVMLTYRREEVVRESIERLKGLDHLAKVILVWNDPDTSPYSIEWPNLPVPLEIVWCEGNSLNNRFLPFSGIHTEAVLSIDDDIYLRHDEIQFAFRVWRESRDRLVGFPGRFHSYDIKHNSWLYNSNYTCELSMVLTGAAFIHKYYMYLYSLWQSQEVRDIVDSRMNCEDIAMNFLIAHLTRKPPLKVTSRWTFRCPSCPETLSQNDAHFDERHSCINDLVKIYGYMPLLYTQYRLDSVLFKTRLPSHLEKCYQYV